MIKVFGHKSPDTDTVGSAILWAWYLNTHTTLKAEPFRLGELNKETSFVLENFKISEPSLLTEVSKGDKVAIVDTNNADELFENINDTEIIQIVDHHRLTGTLKTKQPLEIIMKKHACTATVIYDQLGENFATMPDDMKGLMMSCILSDTLCFRSLTTTPHDKSVVETIALNLEINFVELADKMFEAKSDISDYTDIGLLKLDSKKTAIGDKNFRVSVIETMKSEMVISRKLGLISAINELLLEETDLDGVLFFIVDILNEKSTVLIYSDYVKSIVETSFGVSVSGDSAELAGVTSRKLQIIPNLKLPISFL